MGGFFKLIGLVTMCIFLYFCVAYMLFGEAKIGNFMLQKTAHINLAQTYVLSLDRLPKRYIRIEQELKRHNIEHIKFSAVDGLNLLFKDENGNTFMGLDIKNKTSAFEVNKKYHVSCPSVDIQYFYDPKVLDRPLTPGELGCYCSHLQMWNDILKKGYDYALIFEDDAMLSNDFDGQLDYLLMNLPYSNMDFIYLFSLSSPHNPKYTILNNQAIYKYKPGGGIIWCTVAYIISKEGAKKMFDSLKIATRPVDDMINSLVISNKIHAYATTGQYVYHDFLAESIIGTEDR